MKGNRSEEKESSLLFVHVTYVITNFQLMYHFIARFYQKSHTAFKHRDSLACVVVYKTTWF